MGTYEPCVLGSDGNCTRWSHDHAADRPSVTDNARTETTTGAIARGEALAAGDPDWMNVTRWPRAETTTATTEDAARVINEVLGGDMDNHARIAAHRLADAGLLATARTRPTRYEVARAIRLSRTNGLCTPGVRCDLCDCAQDYEDDLALRDADAVLALLRDGAR